MRINGDFFDFGLSNVAGKGILYFLDTVVNTCIRALGKHLDSAVRQVADKTGQLMAVGYMISSETKADTLNPADENYLFGDLAHFPSYINPSRLSLQVCILSVTKGQID